MTTGLASTKQLFIKMGKQIAPVESLADASKKYVAMIESQGWGASQVPRKYANPVIIDDTGKFIGAISYNGKVWNCKSKYWTNDLEPIYNPYHKTNG